MAGLQGSGFARQCQINWVTHFLRWKWVWRHLQQIFQVFKGCDNSSVLYRDNGCFCESRADGHFSPTFKSLPRNWCWASKRGGYISRHISAPLGCVKWGQLEPCTFFSSPMVAASLWLTVVPESCYLSSFFPALSSSCMRTTPQFEMTNLVCGPSNTRLVTVWTGRYYIIEHLMTSKWRL